MDTTGIIMAAVGASLALIGILDMLSATLGVRGGFFGRRLINWLWVPVVRIQERLGLGRGFLRLMGISSNLGLIVLWGILIVAGWTLILCASDQAVTHTSKASVDGMERFHFTVSILSGLGRGDWRVADTTAWRLVAMGASMTGTFIISFSISYLIPILGAATQRRVVAHQLALLGDSAEAIVDRHTGDDRLSLQDVVSESTGRLVTCYEKHRTYPSIYFFVSSHGFNDFALRFVIFAEAVELMAARDLLPEATLIAARSVVDQFLDGFEQAYRLKADPAGSADLTGEAAQRRARLNMVLRNNGWPPRSA